MCLESSIYVDDEGNLRPDRSDIISTGLGIAEQQHLRGLAKCPSPGGCNLSGGRKKIGSDGICGLCGGMVVGRRKAARNG